MNKTDVLKKIWKEQKSFQYNFYNPDNLSETKRIELTKEFILCIHRELGEILNMIPWKLHRKQTKKYNKEHLQEEIIDCFKFLLNLCILQEMTPENFEKQFFKKSKIVKDRYKNEIKNSLL